MSGNRILTLQDLPDNFYKGKKVLLRVDLNVPITEEGVISEDYRIRRTIPSIEYLRKRKAIVILASHLGRPGGKFVEHMSLKPVAKRLSIILGSDNVGFVDDSIGKKVKDSINNLEPGDVLLLENLRFHEGETSNDHNFAKELSSSADIYVNDAFSTSHRKHASTYGISDYFELRISGFLVQKEIEVLKNVRDNPGRPFTLIIGGAKIKDKIRALKNLITKADKVILGGGPAYTFLASQGFPVGDSINEPEYFDIVREISNKHYNKILLPLDHLVEKGDSVKVVTEGIPEGYRGVDIGPETISFYTQEIMDDYKADSPGTIFWNGPVGRFEYDISAHGTIDIARAFSIAYWRGAYTVVGGGDTTAALRKAHIMENEVDFVSTGGGATLMYLGGEEIPGITILNNKKDILTGKKSERSARSQKRH